MINNKRRIVENRTNRLMEKVKNRMDLLVTRAFLTGAFDIDYAFENDNLIPQAIVNAVLMTLAAENTNASTTEINKEAENIFQFI